MPTDRESNEIKKSMAYDLIDIIESSEGKESYTPEEIKALSDWIYLYTSP